MVLVHIELDCRNVAGLIVHLKCDPPFYEISIIRIGRIRKIGIAPYTLFFSVDDHICSVKIIIDKIELCAAADFHTLTVRTSFGLTVSISVSLDNRRSRINRKASA